MQIAFILFFQCFGLACRIRTYGLGVEAPWFIPLTERELLFLPDEKDSVL